MINKLVITAICLVAISFVAPQAFAFEVGLIDVTLQDASVAEYPNYDIITLIFSIFNGDTQPAEFTGHNLLYLNDTNGDWWEYSNHLDYQGISETDCPQLGAIIPSGNSTDIKLCYLVLNDPQIGYSLILNDNQYFKDNQTKELVLESVPDWFTTTANAWCTDAISDSEYINSAQFNIQEGIIDVLRGQSGTDVGTPIPAWVKTNACDWSNNQISDYEYLDGIYWLIDNGKIQLA